MLIHVIRPIPQAAIDFVKQHEGCRLDAYPDAATGSTPWTIGYGSTRGVVKGMTITPTDAETRLRADLESAAQLLEDAITDPIVMDLTSNQYAALLSFTFNVGIRKEWGLCVKLRARDYDSVPAELMRFVNAAGRKMQGLVERRADEVKLWSTDEPGSTPESPPSSITRQIDTPPTPVAVKPLSKSKTFLTSAATAIVATVGPMVDSAKDALKSVSDTVSPYVGDSVILSHMKEGLSLGIAGLAIATLFFAWLKDKRARQQ